jgi:8-oxo-dGTP pyrophosphatase MutT (NUDIX family)
VLREVEEETGLLCALGAEVAVGEYEDAAGRPKRVRYFAMRPDAEVEPTAENEVDAVCWIARRLAPRTLSYARDVGVVERAAPRVD